MDNITKTSRIIELLEELGDLESQKAVLEIGPYTPAYVRGAIEAKRFEIAEIAAEIVQIVKDLEARVCPRLMRVAVQSSTSK